MSTFIIGDREYNCPLYLGLSTIMGKWKGLIVWALLDVETIRYGELKRKISSQVTVTDKMLIQSLREMERDGLLTRKEYNEVPPKVEYTLTKDGLQLKPIIDALTRFGETYKVASSAV